MGRAPTSQPPPQPVVVPSNPTNESSFASEWEEVAEERAEEQVRERATATTERVKEGWLEEERVETEAREEGAAGAEEQKVGQRRGVVQAACTAAWQWKAPALRLSVWRVLRPRRHMRG